MLLPTFFLLKYKLDIQPLVLQDDLCSLLILLEHENCGPKTKRTHSIHYFLQY